MFANSRRLAERLTAHLNELQAERDEEAQPPSTRRRRLRSTHRPPDRLGRLSPTGRDHGAVRVERRPRRQLGHPHRRPGPPRLGEQGAAGPDRGGSEVGSAALRGRHLLPRARHRHGRGRHRRPGRGAAVGGQRAAAGRSGRAPGGRHLARGVLPQPPRRPDRVRRGGGADAGRGDRGGRHPAQPAGRAGSADRRRGGRGRDRRPGRHADRDQGRRRVRAGPPGRRVPGAAAQRVRGDPRHAQRALSLRGLRRAAPPDRVAARHRGADRATRRPAAGRHLGRHHPRPWAVRCLPGRRGVRLRAAQPRSPGRRAGRGDGLRDPGR